MNTVSRGVRNAFRNVIRTGSIVTILALSIGLIIAMLAVRQAVNDRITSVKSNTGNTVNISPAGVRGFDGGGTALTTDQATRLSSISHVTKVVDTLSDRVQSSDTSLQSGIEPGQLGRRFNSSNSSSSSSDIPTPPTDNSSTGTTSRSFTMPITITGVTDASAIRTEGTTSVSWISGSMFDESKDQTVAVLGKAIATKNNLSVGSTFTAYSGTIFTVVGLYDSGNTFNNNGVYIPLSTLQRLSSQPDAITSIAVTVDSSDNLVDTTTAIKNQLGSAADVTNSADVAAVTTKPLESVASVALFSLIGAVIAGAVIILLTMLMTVRERRREIGAMKAIGASNLTIMWQFIVEAITLTALALVVGTGIGVAAATPLTTALVDNSTTTSTDTTSREPGTGGPGGFRGIGRAGQQTVHNITASVGASTLAAGVGATLVIAILGSAVPAFMISKIKPADAMRNE